MLAGLTSSGLRLRPAVGGGAAMLLIGSASARIITPGFLRLLLDADLLEFAWILHTLHVRRMLRAVGPLFVAVQLHGRDVAVMSVLGHEFVMRAGLRDPAFFDHEHQIRALHGADAVRDDE